MSLKFVRVHTDAKMPFYATSGAAGMDICAVFDDGMDGMELEPGDRGLISTGLRIEIPTGYEVQVRPRSGLALKNGVTVLNAPGTIDSDYRGEIGVVLINHGDEVFTIRTGDRIAQLVLARAYTLPITEVALNEMSHTERGASGYGSTGVK